MALKLPSTVTAPVSTDREERAAEALYVSLEIAAGHAAKARRRATPKNQKILDELLMQNVVIQEAAKKAKSDLAQKHDLYENALALMERFTQWIAALPV